MNLPAAMACTTSNKALLKSRLTTSALRLAISSTILMSALGGNAFAYDGPTFTKGMWLFQRSTESVVRHYLLPNARRVKVEQPVVRCVDPTEAMMETFRPTSVGSCQSTAPTKDKNAFVFAKRCDFLGPVKTVITVESPTAYRETNELLVGKSPKRDIVIARRIGDCHGQEGTESADLGGAEAAALARAARDAQTAEPLGLEVSAARRTDREVDNSSVENPSR